MRYSMVPLACMVGLAGCSDDETGRFTQDDAIARAMGDESTEQGAYVSPEAAQQNDDSIGAIDFGDGASGVDTPVLDYRDPVNADILTAGNDPCRDSDNPEQTCTSGPAPIMPLRFPIDPSTGLRDPDLCPSLKPGIGLYAPPGSRVARYGETVSRRPSWFRTCTPNDEASGATDCCTRAELDSREPRCFQDNGDHGGLDVYVMVDDQIATDLDGPIIVYWHGSGSNATTATKNMSQSGVDSIVEQGGIVIVPDVRRRTPADAAFGLSELGHKVGPWIWWSKDFEVVDEAIACLHRQYTFNTRRIHALGISAGGLQSTAHAVLRPQYIASIASISGGAGPLKSAEERERDKATAPCGADIGCAREEGWGYPDDETVYNSTSAQILFHGGTRDVVAGNSFKQLSLTAEKEVKRSGKFAVLCDHGSGHSWPANTSSASFQFFADHPYGQMVSPYVQAGALPPGVTAGSCAYPTDPAGSATWKSGLPDGWNPIEPLEVRFGSPPTSYYQVE